MDLDIVDSESDTDDSASTPSSKASKKRRRGRPPGLNYKGPEPRVPSKMPWTKAIEGDDEYFENLDSPGNPYKKVPKLVPITDAEKGMTPFQRLLPTIEDVTHLFSGMDFLTISAETVRLLDVAEKVRKTAKSLKGDLSGKIKKAIFVVISTTSLVRYNTWRNDRATPRLRKWQFCAKKTSHLKRN